jgi:uncharacterized protein (TIGR03663 family)
MAPPKKKTAPEPAPERPAQELSPRTWWILAGIVLLFAVALRAWDLDLKPFHHDEGVNGFFLRKLVNEGVYQYDPANYHGPSLYYASLISVKLFGTNTEAVRLVPLLFGLATVGVALAMRRKLGTIGALAAGAILAISPGAVFHSRYFIHEMLLVFFTVGLVLAAFAFVERKGELWLVVAALCAALMFATKETTIISWGVLLIATAVMWVDRRFVRRNRMEEEPGVPYDRRKVTVAALIALVLAVAVSVTFYSSFFTHWPGVRDSLRTFEIWAKTGEQSHVHPWFTYLKWMWKLESPVLLLGFIGTVFAVVRGDRFPLFAGLWAWGTFAAYSLIPYKTPWLTLNFMVPLAILGGYGIQRIADRTGRPAAGAILAVALVVAFQQSINVNFMRYDDESVPYVYAPTNREFLEMLRQIERLADRAGTGNATTIAVLYPEYWPMPWYLQQYKAVGFYGSVVPSADQIIVGSEGLRAQVEATIGPNYVRLRSYHQRNGLEPTLYARRDVVECPVNPEDGGTR